MHIRAWPGPIALVVACMAYLPACYVEAGPPVTAVEADGYAPAYYDGYIVYYDTVGRPYYYENGAVVWVSPGSPHYAGLVNHWHVYGHAYGNWYGHYGYRYRGYRAAPHYHAYHGYHGHAR